MAAGTRRPGSRAPCRNSSKLRLASRGWRSLLSPLAPLEPMACTIRDDEPGQAGFAAMDAEGFLRMQTAVAKELRPPAVTDRAALELEAGPESDGDGGTVAQREQRGCSQCPEEPLHGKHRKPLRTRCGALGHQRPRPWRGRSRLVWLRPACAGSPWLLRLPAVRPGHGRPRPGGWPGLRMQDGRGA